jgi:hypothetical protein
MHADTDRSYWQEGSLRKDRELYVEYRLGLEL